MAVGWYRIDFARSRHTNPARIPVSPLGCRYQYEWAFERPGGVARWQQAQQYFASAYPSVVIPHVWRQALPVTVYADSKRVASGPRAPG
jgi:hypothetical protein